MSSYLCGITHTGQLGFQIHALKDAIVVTNEKCVPCCACYIIFSSVFWVLLFSPVPSKAQAGDNIQCKYNGCKISNNFMIFVIS